MHAVSAPTFARMLRNLATILKKAEAHAKAKNIDPSVLLNARLAPDMHPLTRQVQMACDSAKGAIARLAGKTPEAHDDTETTFAELHARIARVIDIVNSFSPADLEGSETREITIKIPNAEFKFAARTTCSRGCCRTSISTSPPPTRSCGTTASSWASATS